jgi:hypothetical protein
MIGDYAGAVRLAGHVVRRDPLHTHAVGTLALLAFTAYANTAAAERLFASIAPHCLVCILGRQGRICHVLPMVRDTCPIHAPP